MPHDIVPGPRYEAARPGTIGFWLPERTMQGRAFWSYDCGRRWQEIRAGWDLLEVPHSPLRVATATWDIPSRGVQCRAELEEEAAVTTYSAAGRDQRTDGVLRVVHARHIHASGPRREIAEFTRDTRGRGFMVTTASVAADITGARSQLDDLLTRLYPNDPSRAELWEAAAGPRARQTAARARDTLKRFLTAEQWASYEARSWFDFTVEKSGHRYRIAAGRINNVRRIDSAGETLVGYCAHAAGAGLPDADIHLGQMLALKADEEGFLAKANIWYGSYPG